MDFLARYLFLIPLCVLVLSEFTKIVYEKVVHNRWRPFFMHGGLPSSHSAFVTSLLIIVGRKTGIESVEFCISAVFAAVVWYDAFAIRSHVNEQAKILNTLQRFMRLNERVGHTFVEVISGIAFGAIVTMIGIWVS